MFNVLILNIIDILKSKIQIKIIFKWYTSINFSHLITELPKLPTPGYKRLIKLSNKILKLENLFYRN